MTLIDFLTTLAIIKYGVFGVFELLNQEMY